MIAFLNLLVAARIDSADRFEAVALRHAGGDVAALAAAVAEGLVTVDDDLDVSVTITDKGHRYLARGF